VDMMEDQPVTKSLDSLLLQLALETRELAQKKEDLKQQIQIYRSNIQEQKKYIDETQKTLNKLEEDILQNQNTVKCYTENVKRKMFEERIENYRTIFQQYKEEYCQNPLAKKLLSIQAENEEIEKRIRAKEEQITVNEKEMKDLQGVQDTCDSGKKPMESEEQQASKRSFQPQANTSSHKGFQPQGTETEQDDVLCDSEEKATENNQEPADGCDESNASQVGAIGSTVWTKHEIRCEQNQVAERKQQEQSSDMDCNMNTSCGSDVMEDMIKVMEVEDQQETERGTGGEGTNKEAVPLSPIRMTAVLNTPTFSLNDSPSTSPGHQETSETPAFIFSLNSGPSTPGFSGFGCSSDVGSSQNEESPFTFTSPYFTSKKSPETKLPGFLFDEIESRPEEVFAFSFGSKSPQPSSSTQEPGEAGEAFPFSFSFGKF
ncbi:hypothetical protein NFI96_027334, partial [Prochilodus magdalenae]